LLAKKRNECLDSVRHVLFEALFGIMEHKLDLDPINYVMSFNPQTSPTWYGLYHCDVVNKSMVKVIGKRHTKSFLAKMRQMR
jgi:hypothetical protein